MRRAGLCLLTCSPSALFLGSVPVKCSNTVWEEQKAQFVLSIEMFLVLWMKVAQKAEELIDYLGVRVPAFL